MLSHDCHRRFLISFYTCKSKNKYNLHIYNELNNKKHACVSTSIFILPSMILYLLFSFADFQTKYLNYIKKKFQA